MIIDKHFQLIDCYRAFLSCFSRLKLHAFFKIFPLLFNADTGSPPGVFLVICGIGILCNESIEMSSYLPLAFTRCALTLSCKVLKNYFYFVLCIVWPCANE